MTSATTGPETASWADVADMSDPDAIRLLLAQGERILEKSDHIESRLDTGDRMRDVLVERVENLSAALADHKAQSAKQVDELRAQLSESWLRVVVNGFSSVATSVMDAFKARPREFSLTVIAFFIAVLALRGVIVETQWGSVRHGTGGDDDSEESEPGTWAADDDDHDGGTINDDQPDAVVGSPHVR